MNHNIQILADSPNRMMPETIGLSIGKTLQKILALFPRPTGAFELSFEN